MKTKIWFVLFYKKKCFCKDNSNHAYTKVKFKSTSYYFKGNLNEKIFKLN